MVNVTSTCMRCGTITNHTTPPLEGVGPSTFHLDMQLTLHYRDGMVLCDRCNKTHSIGRVECCYNCGKSMGLKGSNLTCVLHDTEVVVDQHCEEWGRD